MKTRDTSSTNIYKIEEKVADAYSLEMINESHHSLLKDELSKYEKPKA